MSTLEEQKINKIKLRNKIRRLGDNTQLHDVNLKVESDEILYWLLDTLSYYHVLLATSLDFVRPLVENHNPQTQLITIAHTHTHIYAHVHTRTVHILYI